MTPDLVLDARAQLGEGPVWLAARRELLWVDIYGHALHVTSPDTAYDRVIAIGEAIGCVAPAGPSLVVAGLQSGFSAIDLDTERRVAIEDPELHLPQNRFNDGKCDPAGRFWAGTMHVQEEPGHGSLYCLDPALRVSCKVPGVSISNGLAWTSDARTLYYVDSPTREVAAWDYDVATGEIRGRRRVFSVPEGDGFPDGLTIDADDQLWLALWDGWKVIRIDPVSGAVTGTIAMPVSRPTSCAFGGDALDVLYITSARTGLTDSQLAAEPLAGGVFACRPGVRGVAAAEFGGGAQLRRLFSAGS